MLNLGVKIQNEQTALESQLWDERLTIQKKHQEKVKVAVTKLDSFSIISTVDWL